MYFLLYLKQPPGLYLKRTTVGRDTCKNVLKHAMPNQTVIPFCFFSIISAQGGLFFKPIFALKPWDQGGRFGYNKRYKRSFLKSEIFCHEPRKWPKKPKIAGKLELIGKKGFSFRYLWPLIEWNQLIYPMH